MILKNLVQNLESPKILDPSKKMNSLENSLITSDSREVSAKTLFVAIQGFQSDGHQYIAEVLQKGCEAVVVEKEQKLPSSIVQIVVPDSRKALSILVCEFYGHPSKHLCLVGVTGTNGKTTSTYLLESIFKEAHFTPGVMGTINYRYLGKEHEASHTTPESTHFQLMLKTMKDKGVSHIACEVSSHALELSRVYGTHFNVALFTNLTQDHLDFHQSFENYFEAKKRFFIEVLPKSEKKEKMSVINMDDSFGERIVAELKEKKLPFMTYALSNSKADVYAKEFSFDLKELKAILQTSKGSLTIHSSLLGHFNLLNILGATTVSLSLNIPLATIQRGIQALKRVPGRLERVDAGQDFLVLVDYAHTDDALKNVGKALLKLKKNRIITVFGCGGDRDRKKRPLMAKAAITFSDIVVITSDNPRTEVPEKIIEEILVGTQGAVIPIQVEVDRKRAIQKAIELAEPSDIILIAGKGHEDYQILGKTKIHFDDREIAREVICLKQKRS